MLFRFFSKGVGVGMTGMDADGKKKIDGEKRKKVFFFFEEKTAYEVTRCDWSSDGVLFRSHDAPPSGRSRSSPRRSRAASQIERKSVV